MQSDSPPEAREREAQEEAVGGHKAERHPEHKRSFHGAPLSLDKMMTDNHGYQTLSQK